MKTLCIDASSKKGASNSGYFIKVASRKMNCEEIIRLPRNKKYDDVLNKISDIDQLVIALPLYVDGIPSHVLMFLERLESYCIENQKSFKLYVIANCGFYEGEQTSIMLDQLKCFCKKADLIYGGAIGIGAGEMLGFIRYLPMIGLVISLIAYIIAFIIEAFHQSPDFIHVLLSPHYLTFLIQTGLTIIWSYKSWFKLLSFGKAVSEEKTVSNTYTTLSFCPKCLFIVIASIFWYLRLIFVHKKSFTTMFNKEQNYVFKGKSI